MSLKPFAKHLWPGTKHHLTSPLRQTMSLALLEKINSFDSKLAKNVWMNRMYYLKPPVTSPVRALPPNSAPSNPAPELNSRPSQPPSRPHHTTLHLHPLNFNNNLQS